MGSTSITARWYYEIDDAAASVALSDLAAAPEHGRGVLLRGATIVSMDPTVGDLASGDLLIENTRIEAIGRDLRGHPGAARAVTVDMRGMIVAPGLVDGHRHCWQSQFRRLIPDADIGDYMATMHGGVALHYRPEDMYVGTLLSLLGSLANGVTTVVDFSHNSRSRAHSDAVFRAYTDSGVRAVHAYGTPNAGEWDRQWPEASDDLRAAYCGGNDSLVSIRLGLYSPQRDELASRISFAREHGLGVTIDGVVGAQQSRRIEQLARGGHLGPDVTLIHCTDLSPSVWADVARTGTRVTLATTSDQQIGLADGRPPVQQAIDHGIRPGLSTDVEVSLGGDMFTEMRATLALQRMGVHTRRYLDGFEESPALLTNRELLAWATVHGADGAGVGDRVGSLTPGKAADLIAVKAQDVETLPSNDAVGTLVQVGHSGLVDTVFVAGRLRKWRGQLVGQDLAALRELVRESRDRLAASAGLETDPVRAHVPDRTAFSHITTFVAEIGGRGGCEGDLSIPD